MTHWQFFPVRAVRPGGWLKQFLELQADGLTGHVAVSGYPYGYKFWGTRTDNTPGSYEAWWPYEQTAYWLEGALKCGYLLDRPALYHSALEEIEFALAQAAPDGFIGPESLRAQDRWPHAVFFRAVIAQYEITGNPHYLEALLRHYRATPHPMGWDRDVTGVEIALYLHQATGAADMLALAEDLYARFNAKWPAHDCALNTLCSAKALTTHGVTFNEEAKLAAMLFAATGKASYREAAQHGYAKLAQQARLADGLHSSSEHIQGKTARDMHETCNITDHTWALMYLLQATGAAHYADTIEQIIYNALPGSITKDFRALQYFSAPNQVIATDRSNHNPFMHGLNWMSYRPDHEVQCCPGNVHRALPNFITRLWLRAADTGGICAACYGPGELHTTTGAAHVPTTITAHTHYPFEQAVEFAIQPAAPVAFPFTVRIPGWCQAAQISLNGQKLQADLPPGSFFTLNRVWQAGDMVRLELPFTLRLEHWPDNGVSMAYGPLTLAYAVPTRAEIEKENSTTRQRLETLGDTYQPRPTVVRDDFPAWHLYPAGAWNYALQVDETTLKNLVVEWNPHVTNPWDAANPAVRVRVPVRRVRGWRLVRKRKIKQHGHWAAGAELVRGWRTITGDFHFTPPLPNPATLGAKLAADTETIDLIPYGATLLRVTVFPHAVPSQ